MRYLEIQNRLSYRVIDLLVLSGLCGFQEELVNAIIALEVHVPGDVAQE